jgi:predicted AAA+ superfamily ATPase
LYICLLLTTYLRYLHQKIDWGNRLTAIVGARGTGKTTLLLQHIKLHLNLNDTLYVNADDFYFAENKLFDLASSFYLNGGKHLFIDEIHKYPQWSHPSPAVVQRVSAERILPVLQRTRFRIIFFTSKRPGS